MIWRLAGLSVLALSVGSCSTWGERACDAGSAVEGVALKAIKFKLLVSEYGVSRVWIGECRKTYFISPKSINIDFTKKTASQNFGESIFAGEMDGRFVYMKSIDDTVVRIDKINKLRPLQDIDINRANIEMRQEKFVTRDDNRMF